ncbi:FAS1 domain-containing protein [Pterulicium gracile]|uniref:FAS1 domain-containing protein n=1 Tax=Pterulicium gracile TaxID=1884261 RepID=A0A5C3R1S8_9AGAR|nr:FAS1 domain-containing protein [Pterula gracilis]
MRLPPTALLLLLPLCLAAQLPFVFNTTSVSIIDVLSKDPDYESLLHLLQRTKLIPTLNKLRNATLFAPTNEAIKAAKLETGDNIQHELRQRLLYHLLNYTLPSNDDIDADTEDLEVLHTLYYPELPVEPPTNEPPPYPPWLPIPGGGLGGESQRLRLASRKRVAVDAFGKGGANIVKEQVQASNGMVMGIDEVIDVPPDLAQLVTTHPQVSYFARILQRVPSVITFLNSTQSLTLFLPVDSAWDALHRLERLYLESEFAVDDLQHILRRHAVSDTSDSDLKASERAVYSEQFSKGLNLTTLSGKPLTIETDSGRTKIGKSAELVQPDLYASNGVIHLVSSLLMKPESLALTTEKYLLALNCTRFVSLLHSVGLQNLVNGTEAYTVLAISDEVLALYGLDLKTQVEDGEPDPGGKKLERRLRYHFLSGKWSPESLFNGQLLKTALIEPDGLRGGQQVIKVETEANESGGKSVRFGGAGVIGEFVTLPNSESIIYFLSRPLTPPASVQQAALPRLHLSTFFAALSSLPAPHHPPAQSLTSTPLATFMVPHNDAFNSVGELVTRWLLDDYEGSKADLEKIIRHHVIRGVVYTEKLMGRDRRTYETLEGSDVEVDQMNAYRKSERANDTLVALPSGGWSGMQALVYPQDLLTSTGVMHEVSDLLIPRSVVIGVGKLVQAAGGNTMAGLIVRVGMEWILTGRNPPKDSPFAQMKDVSWTLLCPTDNAFSRFNLTELHADQALMEEIVRQHLIPTAPHASSSTNAVTNRPLVMDDATYTTALSGSSVYGDVIFKRVDDGGKADYVVGIKGARGTEGKEDWAKVLYWGRTTPGIATNSSGFALDPMVHRAFAWTGPGGGGVISIDTVLTPYSPSWWVAWGGPAAVGLVCAVLICVFFYGVNLFWRKDLTEATYEPVGGFSRGDEDEE